MKRLALALSLALLPATARAWTFDWAGHVEADATDLADSDPAKRLEAVLNLAKYDVALTQDHLLAAMQDSDVKVRHAAAKALGAGGSVAAVPALISWLGDVDPEQKKIAATALGDIGGAEATAALTRTLGDPDAKVRELAVKALGTIGKKGNLQVVVALIPRLEDDKPDVKNATIQTLEELGDKRAVIPLVAKFSETGRETRRLAVRAVGKLGDPSAVPALIRLINDPDDDVRTAAVGALGALGAVDAIDALTEQLDQPNDTYRAKVAYALGQIAATPSSGKAGEEAMKLLVQSLAQPSARNGAREALRVAGAAAVPALVAHLQGRIAGDPASAVALLTDAADPRATAVLSAELERGRVAMPIVLKALGATKDPAALVPVLGALTNKDAAIRLAAMEALRPLIASDVRAGDVLVEHLADEDLEVRVLAAEYLGIMRVGAATPKLIALSGPGNPTRLRHAAIDALGEIGRPEATKPLLDVLREGPTELHRSAAAALAYIADPGAIAALSQQAQVDRGPTRHELVRALGASLRGRPSTDVAVKTRKLLRSLAQDANIKTSLAAIAGLAAGGSAEDAPYLRDMLANGAADRRRAAAWALGELRDPASIPGLSLAMSSKDDRLVGDAAWALGEILAATPQAKGADGVVDQWLHVAKFGGWAGAIDSTGALSRMLWALPKDLRTQALTGTKRTALLALAFHKSRLVRINVVHALASLPGDADATKALAQLAKDDSSGQVRAAAEQVKTLATTAPPARTEWRNFYVVDRDADDAPVRQEAYFVHTSDGLVWASYTDARGELTNEHIPAGDADVWPANRESEY
ncbi:MAG TPA: HEAT repeat domain-containing protein [Kofleriaceae bacterium]|jgi:HEAT repeat protein